MDSCQKIDCVDWGVRRRFTREGQTKQSLRASTHLSLFAKIAQRPLISRPVTKCDSIYRALMASIRTSNNPAMLTWAREQIGYSLEQAAEAIGISANLLAAAESKDDEHRLTLAQLRKAAEAYGTPFGYFYLSEAPHDDKYLPVPDYRMDPNLIGVDHPRLHLEIKKIRSRREIFIDIVQNLGHELPSFRQINGQSASETAKLARNRLGVTQELVGDLSFGQAYSFWKSRIENDGALVYESQYIPKASGVIGAALSYDLFPVILVGRGAEINVRKLFTLLHEYAHLLVGESALNDARAQMVRDHNSAPLRLEAFCNQVAAEILVPPSDIRIADYHGLDPVESMERLAHTFKVTYTTAAVCLQRMGIIDDRELAGLLQLRRDVHKAKAKKTQGDTRIPRENIMRLDLGRPMFDAVLTAYSDGLLDVFDASTILNLRVKKIDKLVSATQ